jgi:hypothetical protein
MENKECLFYIDHNPPECSGTWGGAIHKGACKVNSTDCADTPQCFIKKLYSNSCKFHQYKQALIEIEDYVRDNCDFDKSDKLISDTGAYDILEMIPYDIKQRTVSNARMRGEK